METITSKIHRNPTYVGVVVGFGFVIMGIIGTLAFGVRPVSLAMHGVTTTGQIVGAKETGKRNDRTYAPVIAFSSPDGEMREVVSRMSTSEPPTVGTAVMVRYDARDPSKADIDSFAVQWGGMLGCLGFLVIGLCIGLWSRRELARQERFRREGARVDAGIIAVRARPRTGMPASSDDLLSRSGWDITATATDPVSGQSRTYAGRMPGDKNGVLNPLRLGAKTVPVYVDRQDPARTFMDVQALNVFNLFPERFSGKTTFQKIGVMQALVDEVSRGAVPDDHAPDLSPGIPQIQPPPPANPQMADYVRQSRAAGVDDATIRQTLLSQGWNAPDIDAGLR